MEASVEFKLLTKLEKDDDWFHSNLAEIQKNYEKKFVAVKDGKIVASSQSIGELIKALKKKKINPALTLVEFVHEKGVSVII